MLFGTINSYGQSFTKTGSTATADPLEVFTYTFNFTCPSTVADDCTDVDITDVLPTNIEFLNHPVGLEYSYDANTGVFAAHFDVVPNGSTISFDIQVRFPANSIDGTEASNVADIEYLYNSTTNTITTSPPVITTVTNGIVLTYSDEGVISKDDSDVSAQSLDDNWNINYGHTYNTPVTNFVLEDILPPSMVYDGIQIGENTCSPGVPYNIEYYIYNSTTMTSTWVASTANPFSTSTTLNCHTYPSNCTDGGYNLAADERITGFRVIYPSMPGDGCFHPDAPDPQNLFVGYYYDENITGIPNPSPGDVTQNCATVTSDQFTSVQDCGDGTVSPLQYEVWLDKDDLTNTGPYQPGEVVRYRLRTTAGSGGDYPIIDPTIMDLLPPELEYIGNVTVAPNVGVTNSGTSTSFMPTISATTDYQGVSGQTLLNFDWDDATGNGISIPPNVWEFMVVEYDVRIKATAMDNATLTNTASSFTDQESTRCTTVDVDDLDNDGNSTEIICEDDVDITILYPPGFAGLNSYKEVKGNLDAAFSKYPNSGQVSPLGNIEYNLCLENPANLIDAIDNIVLVDVLPHVDDRGVVANNELRGSLWQPVFTATSLSDLQTYIASISGATLYFSTECEPCLNADLGAQVTDLGSCSTPNWSTTPPATISDVCSFKIDYGTTHELAIGESTCINLNMQAPSDIPTDGSIAWNSFGYVGTKENGSALLASEPIKVGISAMPAVVNCCQGTNLAQNYSFEDGSFTSNASIVDQNNAMTNPSFGGLPIDNFTSDGNVFWIDDASRATDGNKFIYLPEANDGGKCVYQSEVLYGGNITPCSTYEVSFDIAGFDENGTESETNYILEVFYWNADRDSEQETVQDEFKLNCTTTDAANPIATSSWNNLNWTRVSGTIELPAPTSTDFVNVELAISVNSGGGALIDNICMEKVSDNVSFVATGNDPICTGTTPNDNGEIIISSGTVGEKYDFNTTGFNDLPLTFAGAANTISALPTTVVDNIANSSPTTTYYLRVYESEDCFKDTSIVINQNLCSTPTCSINITSVTPTACNPANNTYDLEVIVSYTDGPGGNITISTSNGQSESFVSTGTSPETFMFTEIASDGTQDIDVTAVFDGDAACTVTSNAAYDAPDNCCPDALELCPGESYTLTADGGLTNYQWFDSSTGSPVAISGATSQTYVANAIGIYTWTATDSGNCPATLCCPVIIEAGSSCCSINEPIVTVECNNNGTPGDSTDDTFTYMITVTGIGISTYAISGSDTRSGLAYDTNNGPFGPFNIADGNLTITITDETDGTCQQTPITITAPAPCSSCPDPVCFPTTVIAN